MAENKEIKTENKMGVKPVRPLLIEMALPIAFSMLVGALYNIVDSIFVAKIGPSALTALSLVFPYQNLIVAVGVGTGVGINALLSKSLGEKNQEKANLAANNGIFLGILSYLVFALVAIFLAKPFMEYQTADATTIAYGITYIQICGVFSFGIMAQLIFEKLLQSTGQTSYILLTQGLGAVINMILDPIMIFGLLGFPAMGVAGAAWATVIGQIIGGCTAVYFNHRKNPEITLSVRDFRPRKQIVSEIYKVGIPSIIVTSIGSVMVFLFNKILTVYSEIAPAILGIYFKLQSFVFMPVFGFTNGMVPIVAYNYGAKNKERVKEAHKACTQFSMAITWLGALIFLFFPKQLLSLFSPTPEMITMGVPALRIIGLNFFLAGYNIVGSSLFQSLGNGLLSMIMSIGRQLVVLIPTAFVLGKIGGVGATWWSFPIAELVAFVLCTVFVKMIYNNKINILPDTPPVVQ